MDSAEKPNIERPYYTKKISRREALKLMAGAVISLEAFLVACGKSNPETVKTYCIGSTISLFVSTREVDCTKLPSVDLDQSTQGLLKGTVRPIASLLPESSQNIEPYMHQVDKLPVAFTAMPQIKRDIASRNIPSTHFFLRKGEAMPPVEFLNIVNYHEVMHIFSTLGRKENFMTQYGVWFTFENNKLFPIVTEGTYISAVIAAGHPQDHFEELYASALTVMHFFPNEFLQNVRAIRNEKARKIVAQTGLDLVNSLKIKAHKHTTLEQLPYKPELIRDLRDIAS